MRKNDLYKSFLSVPKFICDLDGSLCDTETLLNQLKKDIRVITEYTEYVLQSDKELLKDLDTLISNSNISQNSEIGRQLGLSLPIEMKKETGSRFERIFRDRVVREAKSWLERRKAVENTSKKYVSQGWKRTSDATIPSDLAPKMSLSAVDKQYAEIINDPFAEGEIHLKMRINNIWYILIFDFDSQRFVEGKKISLPDIRIDENNRVRFNFTVLYEYIYSPISEKYVVGVDVGISQYATVSVLDTQTREVVYSTTLSRRVHSLYNSVRASAWQVKALKRKKRDVEAALHRAKNVHKKRELAVITGQEIADICARFDNAVLVFEDLGFVEKTMSNGRWNRGELVRWATHFATLNGGRAFKVNAYNTSQVCHLCGYQGNIRDWHTFVCNVHGEYDRDENAAANIALRFIDKGSHKKAVDTRKKAKRFTKQRLRRTPAKHEALKYPRRKTRPTPKRQKRSFHGEVKPLIEAKQHSIMVRTSTSVIMDISAKHTTDRTLKKQCDLKYSKNTKKLLY